MNQSTMPLIDWLFLDLNGIIYKCAMDDSSAFKDVLKGKKFEEIFVNVFNYLNEIIHMIQPQKMLFLAFDGVAPRAKMNQQRARRFKSARKYQELDDALRKLGILEKEEHFKNNSISPGTEFMFELNKHMKFFIQRKMAEDERWRKLKVIFSGVDVPGEGEHKILEYIRRKNQEPGFNPNTSICIYGADADLIFLALTTHLPFVCIFREQLKPRLRKSPATKRFTTQTGYDFLWINVLREYLEIEFSPLKEKMGDRFSIDKIIDDFVFLCFFIGNDFLPRVFCMDIKVGNFDKLIEIFKETLVELDGYINEKGVINWSRAVKLFKKIAEFELKFINDKLDEQVAQQKTAPKYQKFLEEVDNFTVEINKENLEEVEELKEEYDELEKWEEELEKNMEDGAEEEDETMITPPIKKEPINLAKAKIINRPPPQKPHPIEEDEAGALGQAIYNDLEIEEAEDYLTKHSNEENISILLSARALENDIKFMSSLVKVYQRNKSDARKYYYEEKFKFDVEKEPQELTKILTVYMQGLQFVLSYYYTNCPSWSWFYPYYYSPLISDLSNLMEHLNLTNISHTGNLINFDYGKPYDPFKQLLLILPIGSSHLLPPGIAKAVTDEDAPLHQYYPTEFELDPFGAVFDSEYIAKIPFVDEELLDREYEKVMKTVALTPEEIARNATNENTLFEWDYHMKEYEIQPTLPYYDTIMGKIKTTTFSLESIPFDPTKILDSLPPNCYKYHRSFPSLHYIKDKTVEMKPYIRKEVTFYKCCAKLHNTFRFKEPKEAKRYLEKYYYFNYPFLVNCYLVGIVTPNELITNWPYYELPFPYKKSEHKEYYTNLVANVHDQYFKECGILFEEFEVYFAIIQSDTEARRDSLGTLYCSRPLWDIIPLPLIIETSNTPHYRGQIDYRPKPLHLEFPKNSDVIINIGPHIGSLGKVVGYESGHVDFDNVQVKILQPVPHLAQITAAIAKRYDDQKNYRSVNDVAKQMGVDVQVLLTILDCVVVKTEPELNQKSIYPEKFDIGLSLIQKKNHTIVPELIICHELENFKSRDRKFPHFQLAPEAVELLKEYYALHKPVFEAIYKMISEHNPSVLSASYIFPNSKDPNLDLFKVYIWLLKQEDSNLILANKASKVIPREGIRKLEEFLNQHKELPISPEAKNVVGKTFPYNPNFLIQKSLDTWIPPLFLKKPPWHKIGDRVVNLKTVGYSFAPFGATGTVVGILGNKPENGTLEVKIEVLFDKPFIGGTNLGGRCQWGRGAVVDFDDIYNLNSWGQCVKARDRRERYYYEGWDGKFAQGYVPSFQTSEESSGPSDDEVKKKPPITEENRFEIITRDLTQLLEVQAKAKQGQGEIVELPQGLKHLVQKQTQTNLQSQPQNTTTIPTTVPKTLANLKKKEEPGRKESIDEPKPVKTSAQLEKSSGGKPESKIINVSELEGSKSTASTQSNFDFSSFIASNLPKAAQDNTLPNTSYSFNPNQIANENFLKQTLNIKSNEQEKHNKHHKHDKYDNRHDKHDKYDNRHDKHDKYDNRHDKYDKQDKQDKQDKNDKSSKSRKSLKLGAQEFTIVTREKVYQPKAKPVDVSQLEKSSQKEEPKSTSIFNDPAILALNKLEPEKNINPPTNAISAEELEKSMKQTIVTAEELEKALKLNVTTTSTTGTTGFDIAALQKTLSAQGQVLNAQEGQNIANIPDVSELEKKLSTPTFDFAEFQKKFSTAGQNASEQGNQNGSN